MKYPQKIISQLKNWRFVSSSSIACALFIFCSAFLNRPLAQTESTHRTDPYKLARSEEYTGTIAADKEGFFGILHREEKPEQYFLEKFTVEKKDRIFSNQLPMPGNEENPHMFHSLVHLKNGFALFTTWKNSESEQFQAFVTPLNNAGQKVLDPVLIHAVPQSRYTTESYFEICFSPDSSRFLVFLNTPFERKAKEAFELKVYSLDFELLWEKDLELPYEQDIVQVRNFLLDNLGNVFMMSGWAPEKSATNNRYVRPQGGRYVLFHYHWQENKLKEFDVSLKSKSIISVTLQLAANDDLVIAGFFSNDYLFSVAGTFLFTLDTKADQVKTAAMVAFNKEFLSKFMTERAVEKGFDLSDYYLDHMFLDNAGGVVLVGEQFFITERVISDPATGRQTIDYIRNYNDLLVVKLKPEGTIEWNARVAKRQNTYDNGQRCSYASYFDGQTVRIFFNDDVQNQALLATDASGTAREYSNEKNSVTTQVEINAAGKSSRTILSNNQESGYSLRPSFCSAPTSAGIVLGFEESRSIQFMWVN